MGGIRVVLKPGITIHAQDATVQAIEKLGLPLNGAKIAAFTDEDAITIGPRAIELFYPGAGHAPDNSVVFLPGENILFAGCMVKSARSADLGNREDAVLVSWPVSLLKLLDRFGHTKTDVPSPRHADLVIPGHGPPGRVDLIHHTLGLLEQEMSTTTHNGHAKHD
jgi:metallo-beta-lactamase class B